MLRKNIALMSRNINESTLEDVSSPFDFVILKNRDFRIEFSSIVPYITAGKRSIIVIGGDIIIDEATVNAFNWTDPTIALIALKDASWNGWNIIIGSKTRRIYAYMYAEGSVYSWEKPGATIIKYSDAGVWNIPHGQLYIRGLVASKNTIWGAQQKPTPICPTLAPDCSVASAYAYDWDYFRTYDPTDTTQGALPAERTAVPRLIPAAMIIEYDAHILTDPPLGFREMK